MKIVKLIVGVIVMSLCAWSNDNKDITIISGTSTADGSSSIHTEVLEECILKLPSIKDVRPTVEGRKLFLKNVDGMGKNQFVQVFDAKVTVSYMMYQKKFVIITTNSIKGTEPKTKTIEKRFPLEKIFYSRRANGTLEAGQSVRENYFIREKDARNDVISQVQTWLKQQKVIVCNKR